MFGILDETGLLQYGQVFVQFTNNVSLKTPSKAAAKTIIKGSFFLEEKFLIHSKIGMGKLYCQYLNI